MEKFAEKRIGDFQRMLGNFGVCFRRSSTFRGFFDGVNEADGESPAVGRELKTKINIP